MNSRKARGYKSQAIVAAYLQDQGWPYAQPVGAGRPGSDITGVPWDVEVFARRDGLTALLEKLEQQHQRTDFPRKVVIMRPDGWGEARVHLWPAITTLEDWIRTTRELGGNP